MKNRDQVKMKNFNQMTKKNPQPKGRRLGKLPYTRLRLREEKNEH